MPKVLIDSSQFANGYDEPFSPGKSIKEFPQHAKVMRGTMWTEARLQFLRENGATMSASQIAAEIGGGISRGAVIGMMRRQGISLAKDRAKGSSARPQRPSPPSTRPRSLPEVIQFPGAKPSIKELKGPTPEELSAAPRMIGLMELRSNDCRWPIGDPMKRGFAFCGNKTRETGEPYCCAHARIAYRPTEPRARK